MDLNKICESFFDKQWGDKFIRLHSKCVVECCLSLAKETDLDPEVFIIAGWVHDLGRKKDVEKHHIISLDFLELFFKERPEFLPKKSLIADCILNHRAAGNPQTIYSSIIRVCDKVASHHKLWLKSGFEIK